MPGCPGPPRLRTIQAQVGFREHAISSLDGITVRLETERLSLSKLLQRVVLPRVDPKTEVIVRN